MIFRSARVAYDEQIKEFQSKGTISKSDGSVVKIDDRSLAALKLTLEGATNPVSTQSKFEEIIRSEGKAFFSGQKSADAVARLVQGTLYRSYTNKGQLCWDLIGESCNQNYDRMNDYLDKNRSIHSIREKLETVLLYLLESLATH